MNTYSKTALSIHLAQLQQTRQKLNSTFKKLLDSSLAPAEKERGGIVLRRVAKAIDRVETQLKFAEETINSPVKAFFIDLTPSLISSFVSLSLSYYPRPDFQAASLLLSTISLGYFALSSKGREYVQRPDGLKDLMVGCAKTLQNINSQLAELDSLLNENN